MSKHRLAHVSLLTHRTNVFTGQRFSNDFFFHAKMAQGDFPVIRLIHQSDISHVFCSLKHRFCQSTGLFIFRRHILPPVKNPSLSRFQGVCHLPQASLPRFPICSRRAKRTIHFVLNIRTLPPHFLNYSTINYISLVKKGFRLVVVGCAPAGLPVSGGQVAGPSSRRHPAAGIQAARAGCLFGSRRPCARGPGTYK